jgi:hypothetical protein
MTKTKPRPLVFWRHLHPKPAKPPCFVRAKKGPLNGRVCMRASGHRGFHSDGAKEWPKQRGHHSQEGGTAK